MSDFRDIAFALVLFIIEPQLVRPFATSIGLGALVTVVYGVLLLAPWRAAPGGAAAHQGDGAFSLWTALIITVALTGVVLFSAFLLDHLGQGGVSIAAFVSGLGDAHAAIASVASLVLAGRLEMADLVVPGMMALTGNTLTKCVLALSNGGLRFARYLLPAQAIILGAMWLGLLMR